jgi:uncharacterized membrane protein YkvA (DUF1232 family)
MLRALKNQLQLLAETDAERFHAKISQRTSEKNPAPVVSELQNFILLLPDMIAQIRDWLDEGTLPSEFKELHGFLLTYLYHPVDFLSETKYGFFGYLDDAYLVGCVYAKTLCLQTLAVQARSQELNQKVPEWLEMTRRILPAETSQIDQLIEDALAGQKNALERIFASN